MRQGKVFYQNHFAGVVTETNDGDYTFEYDNDYLSYTLSICLMSF